MRNAFTLVVCLFSLITVSVIISPSAAQQHPSKAAGQAVTEVDEVVRVQTTLVTVPVSVRQRDGKLVTRLRREDFRLFEDRIEQEIVYFEPPEEAADASAAASTGQRLTVALLLDTSDSTQFKLARIQAAAVAFIEQLGPDDRVLLVAFDRRVQVLAEATTDRNALRAAISRANTGGGTSLYCALETTITAHLNRGGGRKAIVLLTDGVDTASDRATAESAVGAVEQSDAVIYPIQYDTYSDFADNPSRQTHTLGNLGGTAHMTKNGELASVAYQRATRFLRLLAERTNGRFQYADNLKSLSRSFARIATDLRQQYTLGYYPKPLAARKARRHITVQVGLPKVSVRARESYLYREPANIPD